ncbi:MAG: hypothetical protein IT337_16330 [Thermomicrobiales bacterium]|nr:hypothetical protein [Thermomicrobiales bacterium]
MPGFFEKLLRFDREGLDIPHCPDHGVQMMLRGKQGRPTRFADQTEQEYTYIYFCPVPECNQTAAVQRHKAQIPVAGVPQDRPFFARRDYSGETKL